MKNPTNKRENIIVSSTTSSEVSEETEDKTIEEVKEIDVMDEVPVCSQSNGTADETVEENAINDDKVNAYQKIEEIDSRVKNLRKNSEKLYIHACKYWTQDKKATIAKNTVAGLVHIAKPCGNDVSSKEVFLPIYGKVHFMMLSVEYVQSVLEAMSVAAYLYWRERYV
ncbi:hypothetical protein ZIOFF_070304 [Zingiber officinale]|uniref:Uncharacterized protein n=1 Tax=Zingiber officinale TaxID=94328 RepID=A0A8J5CWM0_ZINOF|nr:hypothetical protein ZIOFF_070304 [Zingiber officinale]